MLLLILLSINYYHKLLIQAVPRRSEIFSFVKMSDICRTPCISRNYVSQDLLF